MKRLTIELDSYDKNLTIGEVHNIDVFPVACFIGEPKHKYSYYMLKANDDLDTDGCETETYEEALEHGLVEALKLIE